MAALEPNPKPQKEEKSGSRSEKQTAANTLTPASFLGSYAELSQMATGLPEICFLGRSNAGKSSFIASLFHNPSLVKVSKKPGSTRTINQFLWNSVHVVDLPGYGYAKTSHREKEKLSELIALYIEKRKELSLGFLLLDCNRRLQPEEVYIIQRFHRRKIKLVLLLTKIDRLNQKELAALKKKWKTASLPDCFDLGKTGFKPELPDVILPVTSRNRNLHAPVYEAIYNIR